MKLFEKILFFALAPAIGLSEVKGQSNITDDDVQDYDFWFGPRDGVKVSGCEHRQTLKFYKTLMYSVWDDYKVYLETKENEDPKVPDISWKKVQDEKRNRTQGGSQGYSGRGYSGQG